MASGDDIVIKLEKPFLSDTSGLDRRLNIEFRQSLAEFASSQRLRFQQDNVGNIYITRPGLDPSLSAIALAFPLDAAASSSSASFTTALHVFRGLQCVEMKIDVTLLGWSSPSPSPSPSCRPIGQEVWEGGVDASEVYSQIPAFKEFENNEDASAFSLSAIFEFGHADSKELVARGSLLLAEKVQKVAERPVKVEFGGPTSRRVPIVSMQGAGAMDVGIKAVREYGRYVVGLFENFD